MEKLLRSCFLLQSTSISIWNRTVAKKGFRLSSVASGKLKATPPYCIGNSRQQLAWSTGHACPHQTPQTDGSSSGGRNDIPHHLLSSRWRHTEQTNAPIDRRYRRDGDANHDQRCGFCAERNHDTMRRKHCKLAKCHHCQQYGHKFKHCVFDKKTDVPVKNGAT